MARPKKLEQSALVVPCLDESSHVLRSLGGAVDYIDDQAPSQPKGRKIKSFQMAVSVDLIGSKMSMSSSKNLSLVELVHGIEMKSKASARTVIIPWSNVKGYEVLYTPDDDAIQK